MTLRDLINLSACPSCGDPVMRVPETGLVSCLASLSFKPCRWFVRLKPFVVKSAREKLSKRDQDLQRMQDEIRKRIEEADDQP